MDTTEELSQWFQVDGVLKFSQEGCGPCQVQAPILKKLCEENGITLTEADLGDPLAAAFAAKMGVRSVPTLVMMKDGVPVDLKIGTKEDEEAALRKFLKIK